MRIVRAFLFLARHAATAWATVIITPLVILVPASWVMEVPEADKMDSYMMLVLALLFLVPTVVFPSIVCGELFRRRRGGSRLSSLMPSLLVVLAILAALSAAMNVKGANPIPLVGLILMAHLVYWCIGSGVDMAVRVGITRFTSRPAPGLAPLRTLWEELNRSRTMQSSVPVTRGTPPATAGVAPESPVR